MSMRSVLLFLILLAGPAGSQPQTRGDRPAGPVARYLPHEMLAQHNALRARVGVPPLVWSDNLAARSQRWANTLLRRRSLDHSPEPEYGENLFEITGAAATPAQVVGDWAREVKDFDYRTNRCRLNCGHYTQIVWRTTREVGCAVARGGGREVWVCNYDPAGNWVGQRPY